MSNTKSTLMLTLLLVILVVVALVTHHANAWRLFQKRDSSTLPNRKLAQLLTTTSSSSSTTTSSSISSTTPTLPVSQISRDQQQDNGTTMSLLKRLECSNGLLTFELSTGFIYKPTSSLDTLAMMPSTLQLTDCLDYCLANSSCFAINFEMGLCVLLATSGQMNPQNLYSSQFPVFTIYAEKKCLLTDPLQAKRRRRCQRAWTFERVVGFEMKLTPRKRLKLTTRELCMEACLSELEFECRSVNWYRLSGECSLHDQDRHSVSQSEAGDQQIKATLSNFYGPAGSQKNVTTTTHYGRLIENNSSKLASGGKLQTKQLDEGFKQVFRGGRGQRSAAPIDENWPMLSGQHYVDLAPNSHVDYLENNCILEPNKLCEFRKIQNRVLKTVDSIYQDIGSLEECKQKCLNAPYRCYSFDYGDTSERVCRTSHLDQASLLSVNEPYLEVVGAITYELAACFNVTIECRAREMVARVTTSKRFQGKMYAKSRPSTCVTDVTNALSFELSMGYHDPACDIHATSSSLQGVFSAELILQHHDRIVTTQDMGLTVYCNYDLGNQSVSNNLELAIEPLVDEVDQGQDVASKFATGTHSTTGTGTGSHKAPHLKITGLATTVVRSPNVTMRITNMNGQPVSSATVGDRLALLFEVKEKTSPFGIFVREIVAMDGRQYLAQQHQLHNHHHHHQQHQYNKHSHHANHSLATTMESANNNNNNNNDTDKRSTLPASILYYTPGVGSDSTTTTAATPSSHSQTIINDSLVESMYQLNSVNSIQFIDSDGCPTDANLMGPLVKMDPQGHRLLAPFDAFKFPTSDMVFFRAVVTSCLAECKPANCPNSLGLPPPTTQLPPNTSHTQSPTSSSAVAPPPHSLIYTPTAITNSLSNTNPNSIMLDGGGGGGGGGGESQHFGSATLLTEKR